MEAKKPDANKPEGSKPTGSANSTGPGKVAGAKSATGPNKASPKKEEKKGSNTGLIVVLILSILANIGLGVGFYLKYDESQQQKQEITKLQGEVTTKDAEVLSKTQELETLQSDLERIAEERRKLGLDNDSLQNQIADLGSTISRLRKTSRLTKAQKAKLERMISDLRSQVLEKDKQIATLKTENDSLATGISTLTAEKEKLGDSLSNAADALAHAAVLKAQNFQIFGVKGNGKEFDDEENEFRERKLDRVKVVFSLADNKAAKKENKHFYVALTTPNGEVFSDPNNGGGILTLNDSTDVLYTMNQKAEFDNSGQKLSFTMLKGFNYREGNYKVAVYCEGFKIGESNFTVKTGLF